MRLDVGLLPLLSSSAAGQAGDAERRGDPADLKTEAVRSQSAPVVPHDNMLPFRCRRIAAGRMMSKTADCRQRALLPA